MAKVTFHHTDGHVDALDVDPGTSLMRAALTHGVEGIVGECGGQAMCATCHVYVHASYLDSLPPVSEEEHDMLDCTAAERDDARSRLGCQVCVTEAMAEIEVDLPDLQV